MRQLPVVVPLPLLLLAIVMSAGAPAHAQAPAPASAPPSAPATEPARSSAPAYWASVTANDVHVRSGPSVDAAYPYLKLDRGALVQVVEESVGWARVPTTGPSFKDAFGYVKADRKVKLSADGRSAEVLTVTDVVAPNQLARFAPDSSWKSIGKIEPGRTLMVLDTIEGSRESVHKIALPPDCDGWVNLTFLRRATPEEIARVEPPPAPAVPATPAGGEAAPATAQPTAPNAPPATNPAGTTSVAETVVVADGVVRDGRTVSGTTTVIAEETTADGGAAAAAPAATAPATAPATATATGPVPSAATQIEQIRLSDLERALEQVRRESPVTAEVGPLRQRFLEFADRSTTLPNQRQFALARAEQLSIQEETQRKLQEVEALLAKATADLEIIRSARQTMDARQPYVAIGRLNASTIYDGVRLPLLYRVQDPTGGQTIGYLEPGKPGSTGGFDLSAMLGQLVGVVGKAGYDDALRVNTIEPVRIDVLTKAPAASVP